MKTVAILILFAAAVVGCGNIEAARVPDAGAGGTGSVSGTGGIVDPSGSGGASGAGGYVSTGAGGAAVDAGIDSGSVSPNLIVDSTDAGTWTSWALTPPTTGTATTSSTDAGYCATLTLTGESIATIGWPATITQGVQLPAGVVYEFSYQASSSAPLGMFSAKVGNVSPSYTTDFLAADVPTTTPQTFTHTFASAGDSAAGIAFYFSTDTAAAVTVCVNSVVLRVVN